MEQKNMATKKKTTGREARIASFTDEEKEYYRLLLAMRDAITGSIRNHVADALDCSSTDKRGVTTHMADMSNDNSRHEMELRMMSSDGDDIDLIDEALQRLFDGEYGRCQDCGEMIPPARLKVRPYAKYCVKCKSIREKNGMPLR